MFCEVNISVHFGFDWGDLKLMFLCSFSFSSFSLLFFPLIFSSLIFTFLSYQLEWGRETVNAGGRNVLHGLPKAEHITLVCSLASYCYWWVRSGCKSGRFGLNWVGHGEWGFHLSCCISLKSIPLAWSIVLPHLPWGGLYSCLPLWSGLRFLSKRIGIIGEDQ